jgi:hypothetical protein
VECSSDVMPALGSSLAQFAPADGSHARPPSVSR